METDLYKQLCSFLNPIVYYTHFQKCGVTICMMEQVLDFLYGDFTLHGRHL